MEAEARGREEVIGMSTCRSKFRRPTLTGGLRAPHCSVCTCAVGRTLKRVPIERTLRLGIGFVRRGDSCHSPTNRSHIY